MLRLYSLAELRLAQAQPQEALDAALTVGEIGERTVRFLGYCPWRSTAAQAALVLGDRDRALELVREALARAERTDVLHLRIRARRVLGLCRGRQGRPAPPAHARCAWACTRRRAWRRSARWSISAPRSGARTSAARRASGSSGGPTWPPAAARWRSTSAPGSSWPPPARVPGARPCSSGPASLTPSERRIAELAATGQTNREIAQALFVTPKTVEYHLRNTYRKLDIQTRQELAGALSV